MNHYSNNTQGQLASFLRRFDYDHKENPLIARSSSAPPVQQDVDDQLLYEHFNHLNLGLDNESYFDHKNTLNPAMDLKQAMLNGARINPHSFASSDTSLSFNDGPDPFALNNLPGQSSFSSSQSTYVNPPRSLHSHFQQQLAGSSLSLPGSGANTPGGHLMQHTMPPSSLNSSSVYMSPNSNPWQSTNALFPPVTTTATLTTSPPGTGSSSLSSNTSNPGGLFMNSMDTPPSSFFPVRPSSALGDLSTSSLGSTSGVYGAPNYSHSVSSSPVTTPRVPLKYPSGTEADLNRSRMANPKYANEFANSYHQLNDEEALVRQFLRQQQQMAAAGPYGNMGNSYNPMMDQMLPGIDTGPRSNSVPPSPRFNGISLNEDPNQYNRLHASSRAIDDYEIYERMLSLGFRLPSGTVPSFPEFVDLVRNPQTDMAHRRNMDSGRSSPVSYNNAGSMFMGRKPLHISSARYNSHSVPVSPQATARELVMHDDEVEQDEVAGSGTSRRRSAPMSDRLLAANLDPRMAVRNEPKPDRRGLGQDEYPRKYSGRPNDEYRRTNSTNGNNGNRNNFVRDGDRPPVRQEQQRNVQRDGNGRNARRSTQGDDRGVERSALLEEFRSSKTKRFELLDVYGHIVEFSSDQHGSRFIQQRLEVATDDEKDLVFEEVYPHALQLMTDVFGNYVIQKFFEHGSDRHRVQLATDAMKGNIFSLSLQMYGCRVVQKALEYVDREIQTEIMNELGEYVLTCVKDQNGNHVIQKAIERITSPKDIQFILNAFHGQLFHLATHPYGCRVVQRIFEHCTEVQIEPLLKELHQHTAALIVDQYGNYVVQHVLEHGNPEDRTMLLNQVKGQVFTLSKHKFASNVVEKCVAFGNAEERVLLVEEVVLRDAAPLMAMMKDQFANYVVQRMLDVVEGEQLLELLTKIRPHLSNLRRFTYGKHLISKVEKLLVQTGLGTASTVASPMHSLQGSRAPSPTLVH